MFKNAGKVVFNLLLILIAEDIIKAIVRRLRHKQFPGELV